MEALIVGHMTAGGGWIAGRPEDFDRSYAIDIAEMAAFIDETQPGLTEALDLDNDSPVRQKFLGRLQGEIAKRGVIDVLRKGVKHGPLSIELFFSTPTPGNSKAEERYAANGFSVTRQLRSSTDETRTRSILACSSTGCQSPRSSSRTASRSRLSRTRSSSISAIVIRRSSCFSSAAAWRTSPSMIAKCGFALI